MQYVDEPLDFSTPFQKLYESRFRKLYITVTRWGYRPLDVARKRRFLTTAITWCEGKISEKDLRDVLASLAAFSPDTRGQRRETTTLGDFREALQSTRKHVQSA